MIIDHNQTEPTTARNPFNLARSPWEHLRTSGDLISGPPEGNHISAPANTTPSPWE